MATGIGASPDDLATAAKEGRPLYSPFCALGLVFGQYTLENINKAKRNAHRHLLSLGKEAPEFPTSSQINVSSDYLKDVAAKTGKTPHGLAREWKTGHPFFFIPNQVQPEVAPAKRSPPVTPAASSKTTPKAAPKATPAFGSGKKRDPIVIDADDDDEEDEDEYEDEDEDEYEEVQSAKRRKSYNAASTPVPGGAVIVGTVRGKQNLVIAEFDVQGRLRYRSMDRGLGGMAVGESGRSITIAGVTLLPRFANVQGAALRSLVVKELFEKISQRE